MGSCSKDCSLLLLVILTFCISHSHGFKFNMATDDDDYEEPKIFDYSAYLSKPNSVVDSKSKVETLGSVLKRHIKDLKDTPNKEVDIVFLVDSSTSVGKRNFLEEIKFVKKLLSDFTVDPEFTRVAVITFASKERIKRQVNYLDDSSPDRHKCSLLEEDLHRIAYTGGGTYTLGAFLEAREVMKNARPTARRAIFLITDGFSNGGDPRPLARALKEDGVKLFTFGIQNGNVKELYDMASEPKNESCYILDTFTEFEALARRALHEDLSSGRYIPQKERKCRRLCVGRNCCDRAAVCNCGIHTGKYECVCPPGYYGNGLKGGCIPCPSGTFKSGSLPGDVYTCKTCPDEHQVSELGATSMDQCVCRKGYRNFNGTGCAVLRCPELDIPRNGYFVNDNCKNVFNAACGLRCKPGYELRGSSLRICRDDGTWSGAETQCIMKTCPAMMKPKNGNMICTTDDFTFNTVCRFTCDTGYKLVGSRKRTCLAISFWTGINTRCREIVCQPLPYLRDGMITEQCTAGEVKFGTTCHLECHSGYTLIGPPTLQCSPKGVWVPDKDGLVSQCVDTSPPMIMCPGDIEAQTDLDQETSDVTWVVPLAVDNSGYIPILTSIPAAVPPTRFPIGTTKVTYIAEDLSKNKAQCAFYMLVRDNQAPTIDRCFSPLPVVSSEAYAEVVWDEPLFSDNSGQKVRVQRSHAPGLFHKGTTEVTYTATDASGNINKCVLTINIIPHPCEYPPAPINGNRTCYEDEEGVTCTFVCMEDYDFVIQPADEYRCALNNVWEPLDSLPVPDCSVQQLSNDIQQPASLTFAGDILCRQRHALLRLEAEFEKRINTRLTELCSDFASCYIDDIETTCEQNDEFNKIKVVLGRNKRSTSGNRRFKRQAAEHDPNSVTEAERTAGSLITFSYLLSGTVNSTGHTPSDIQQQNDLMDTMKKVVDVLKTDTKEGKFNMEINGKPLELTDMSYDKEPVFNCPQGSVLKDKSCLKCPMGMFFNVVTTVCEACPVGSFQQQEGQLTCMKCPGNTSTTQIQATSQDLCKALCLPGTFSSNGVERCETCRKATYQPRYGQTYCEKCPQGFRTLRRGARTDDRCQEKCPAGMVSKTGLRPCFSCPLGTYQDNGGRSSCFICPGNVTTSGTRSDDVTDCENFQSDAPQGQGMLRDEGRRDVLLVNECFDNPCLNNARCVAEIILGYSCLCAPGYQGVLCGNEINECDVNPCLNNGVCVDLISDYACKCPAGFTGKKCDENIDDCAHSPCQNNGVCIDGIQSYTCDCENGYEGTHCEGNIDECASSPCLNGALCLDEVAGYSCECPDGISGYDCEIDTDECESAPCLNGATCVNEVGRYSCQCAPGFRGPDCSEDVDECGDSLCGQGSQKCENLPGSYKCHCLPGFAGLDCSLELKQYYQLDFPSTVSTMDYARLPITVDLDAVTACFWMKTTDTQHQGTPFSYASAEGGANTFTLSDYDGFAFYVNGEEVTTTVQANSGLWHHICIVWASNRGLWKIYKDGLPEDSGRGLASGQIIKGGGVFVVGQEQDSVGGDFSSTESFIGTLTQLHVWSEELSLKKIDALRLSCEKNLGDVVSWPDISTTIRGMLSTKDIDFCKDCSAPVRIDYGELTYESLTAGSLVQYSCPRGFDVAGRSDRQCLVTGQWEGYPPSCQRKSCGFPGVITNGYVEGQRFSFDNRVRYVCNPGYILTGDATRYCGEYGFWEGATPVCEEIKCVIPPLSANTLVIDAQPDNRYSPGTDVYFKCTGNNIFYTEHDNVYCQRDGTFDRSIPTCDPQLCQEPPSIDHASIRDPDKVGSYAVGFIVEYECDFGFELSSNDARMSCLPSGQWGEHLPECHLVQCPAATVITNGIFEISGRNFLDQITYTCDSGYELDGISPILECFEDGLWDPEPPQCLPVSCGRPDIILHGFYHAERYTFGGVLTYECDLGYIMAGESRRNCHADGIWSGRSPNCKAISCGKPETIEHGSFVGRQFTLNNNVAYHCDEGYVLEGPNERICRETGKWQAGVPTCSKVECGNPPDVANGFYTGSSFFYLDTILYECTAGYTLEGENELTCSGSGGWIPDTPVCQENRCGLPSAINYGSYLNPGNLVSFTVEYVIQYACDTGYEFTLNQLNPSGELKCLINGHWDTNTPVCEIKDCGHPPTIENGELVVNETTYLGTTTYSCIEGYELEGKAALTCQDDKNWSGSVPFCKAIKCLPPPVVNNGRLDYKDLKLGSVVRYMCIDGHELFGQEVRRCQADLSFSGDEPECRPVQCEDPGEVEGAIRFLSGLEYRSTVSYACKTGYSMIGESVLLCDSSGQWAGVVPVCEIIQCDEPTEIISNGRMLGDTFTYSSKISYVCDEGYIIDGPSERTCLSSGNWDFPIPVCESVECPRLSVKAGFTSTFQTGFGTTVSITCKDGYKLTGDSERTCLASGFWSGEQSICSRYQCPQLRPPANGQVLVKSGVATYECLPGFIMNGPSTRVCQADETWSSVDTTCDAIACPDITVGGFPYGSMNYDQLTYSSSIIFDCDSGFILSGERKLDCRIDGSWSGLTPACDRIQCFKPFKPSFTKIIGDDLSFNATITYECEVGYSLIGETMRTCLAEGYWSGASVRCEAIVCPRPIPDSFVKISGTSNEFGSVIGYTCLPGHELNGPETRTCQGNGQWSGVNPSCLRVACPQPAALENGRFYAPSYDQGSRLTYECNEGYYLEGTSTRLCLASKQWTGQDPRCVKVICPAPPNLLNGQIVGDAREYEDQIRYECLDGYELVGASIRRCLSVGQWSGANPSCIKVSCGPPPLPSNAIFSLPDKSDEGTFGVNATLECEEGFIGVGTNYQSCQANGAWSQSNFYCETVYCPEFPGLANGQVNGSGNKYGTSLTLQCSQGYYLLGDSKISCTRDGSWSYGSEPECVQISCPRFVSPNNGGLSSQDDIFNIGDKVTYECNEGYRVSGPAYSVCQKDGSWDGLDSYCQLVDCPSPPIVINSAPIDLAQSFLEGVEIKYTCNTGYQISAGDQKLSCSHSGNWAGAVPVCSRIKCGPLPSILNGKVSSPSKDFDSVATYRCNDGFTLKGQATTRCILDGTWSNPAPSCVPVNCGPPPDVFNSYIIDTNEHTFNNVVTYICEHGYRLAGEQTTTCTAAGTWSGHPPRCEPITCPSPPDIANTRYTGDDLHFDAIVTYECAIGYQMTSGDGTLRCQINGVWGGQRPKCVQVSCGPPPVIPNASTTMTMGPNFGSSAIFMCNDGYYLTGSSEAVCTASRQWKYDAMPVCQPVDCGTPQPAAHASLTYKDTTYTAVAIYQCNLGYNFGSETQSTLKCSRDGQWVGTIPDCQPLSCEYPPYVEDSFITVDDYTLGSTVHYECPEGYQLMGDSDLVCSLDGSWVGQTPQCLRIDCGPLYLPKNGYTVFGDIRSTTFAGNTVEFACDAGYSLVGNSVRTCQESGLWSGDVPTCVKQDSQCPPLTGVANSQPLSGNTAVGGVTMVTCSYGYEAHGDLTVRCLEKQTWSKATGTCRKVFCGKPRLRDFVNVVMIRGRSYFHGDEVRYWCRAGVPPARVPPIVTCTADGTWNGEIACGVTCKIPCKNGGVCLGLNRCKCPTGYGGPQCQYAQCVLPCLNGGSCISPYICACPQGYKGVRCQKAVCQQECQNGGRCVLPNRCKCGHGYKQPFCAEKTIP